MERVPSCCAAAADREAASQLKEHAMARMEATVTIVRPVEEVFGFFLALDENAPKVDPSAGSVLYDFWPLLLSSTRTAPPVLLPKGRLPALA
jgi:hypothetical protein